MTEAEDQLELQLDRLAPGPADFWEVLREDTSGEDSDCAGSPNPESGSEPRESPLISGPRESPLISGPRESPLISGPRESLLISGPRESLLISGHRESLLISGPRESPLISGPRESLLISGHRDEEEPLLLLADVALAPPGGGHGSCSCLQVRRKERLLHSIQLQLRFFLNNADNLHERLVSGQDHLETEPLVNAVSCLLYTCQPFFNYLESTARSSTLQYNHVPVDVCPKLLDFSQQLCERLEQLLLTYASHDLLSLDETEPSNMSHFCIGQSQLGPLRLSTFRYCKPTPYLARVDTGLFKRMRWNVEQRRGNDEDGDGQDGLEDHHTDYFFLCYEDIPNAHQEADQDGQAVSHDGLLRMWSIGQWVQVHPDPRTDDICNWITCEVAQASYHRLLFLGQNEPSSCSATDYLQQMLLSHHSD